MGETTIIIPFSLPATLLAVAVLPIGVRVVLGWLYCLRLFRPLQPLRFGSPGMQVAEVRTG